MTSTVHRVGGDLRWLRGIGSRAATARMRVYLFPHAGGGASAYLWNRFFPDDVEVCAVQLPGREGRFAELPLTSASVVAGALAPAIEATADLPYAFFGHSMGALIAFRVTRHLVATGAVLPHHLFVSAFRAPHLPDREPLHGLPDEALIGRLGDGRLAALDPELREMFLRILRADLTLCETYRHEPADPLPCPITAFGGRVDEMVDQPGLSAWRVHTSGEFTVRTFPGGHFYLRGAERQLAHHIRRRLAG